MRVRHFVAVAFFVVLSASPCWGAVKARVYPMGENDPGAAIGGSVDFINGTVDIQSGTDPTYGDDDIGEFVPLVGGGGFPDPTYVAGWHLEGEDPPAGSLAIDFDASNFGVGQLTSGAIDPRYWDPNNWTILTQAWIKPDSAQAGNRQAIWNTGDMGALYITEDHVFEMVSGGSTSPVTSTVEVVYDGWQHVAYFRGGNGATLYLNGSVIATQGGWWGGVIDVTLGSLSDSTAPYDGAIDNFNFAHFADGTFDEGTEIDYFPDVGIIFPDPLVLGDVNQDSMVNDVDYGIWSENAGFNNGFGEGDPGTLILGDVDNNGRINYFDFVIIRDEAAAAGTPLGVGVPEPASIVLLVGTLIGLGCLRRFRRPVSLALLVIAAACMASGSIAQADVVIAEDFYYFQPTKPNGEGGSFSMQDYGGGQNGPAGNWIGRWASSGDGIINGPDHEPHDPPLSFDDQFMAEFGPTFGNQTYLFRDYAFNGLADDQTLFFAVSMRGPEAGTPAGRIYLNDFVFDTETPGQVSMGLQDGSYIAYLGEFPVQGLTPTNDGLFHRFVGKLEINAAGANERLTVWVDPTGVETGPESISVEADVVTGLAEFDGQLVMRADVGAGNPVWWDDMTVATTWDDAASIAVPRLTLEVGQNTGNAKLINETGFDFDLQYYEIQSESGALDMTGWDSLADQGTDGGAWMENNPSANALTESNFGGATTLADGAELDLGKAVQTAPGGGSALLAEDLIARFGVNPGLLNLANVVYVDDPPEPLEADFNEDGAVDGDDFLLWQNGFGIQSDATKMDGDYNNDGKVDGDDFLGWQAEFGSTSGGNGSAAVPEPSAIAALLVALGAMAFARRR